jgi:hypothetical protein
MNESLGASNASSVPPVAESLSVEQGAQASEVRTKWIIGAVLAAFLVGGVLVFIRSSNTPVEEVPANTQVIPAQPATTQPASVPKGKDFGL